MEKYSRPQVLECPNQDKIPDMASTDLDGFRSDDSGPNPQILAPSRLVAHRGFAGEYPENTLGAIVAALDLGVCRVEIDVQLSADGVPHIFHDASLKRTTGIDKLIFDLDAESLQQVSANYDSKFGGTFINQHIPQLDQLSVVHQRYGEANFFVELKRESLSQFGTKATVDAVIEATKEFLDRCVFISFDMDCLSYAREAYDVPVGWVVDQWNSDDFQRVSTLMPKYLFCNHKKLPDAISKLDPGYLWVIYEVSNAGLAYKLAHLGTHLFETMSIRQLLETKG